jgi:hypothetical protein
MKGEAHKWEEVILGTLYFSIVGGGHASMEGKPEKLSRLWEEVKRRHLGVVDVEEATKSRMEERKWTKIGTNLNW